MLNKSAIYVFLGLLASSTIGALSVTDSSRAQPQPPLPASSPGMTNTMPHHMGEKHFIEMMIPHHQSAVMMARTVLKSATHPQIRNLAQAIIKSQTAEIQQWDQAWS